MVYTLDKILRDVRVALDENRSAEPLLEGGDEDSLMLDELICSKVLEAVERVHTQAPYHLLENGHNLGDEDFVEGDEAQRAAPEIYWQDQCSGFVLLPDDFMRLAVFEMSDWERPVYITISATDTKYKMQRSRIKALRGCPQRPVAAVVMRAEGRALEFYSCKSESATITKAVYMPYPHIVDGAVDISERCYKAVVYETAALTLMGIGEGERAAAMLELANGLMA